MLNLNLLNKVRLIWVADCPVCFSDFVYPTRSEENPAKNGVFCPMCRNRNKIAPGILHFSPLTEEEYIAQFKENFNGHNGDSV